MSNVSRMFLATSTWNVIGRGTFLASSFVGTVIVARILPPGTYGQYALLLVLISYATVICDVGLSSGLLRFATEAVSARSSHFPLLLSAVGRQLVVWVCLAVLIIALNHSIEHFYKVTFGSALIVSVVLALLTVLRLDLLNLRISTGRGAAIANANLAFAVVWIVGLLVVSARGASLVAVLLVQTAAMGLMVIWLLLQSSDIGLSGAGPSSAMPPGMVVYSLAFMTRGLVNLVVLKQSEVIFIGRYRSMQDLAIYDVGYSFAFFALMSIHQAIYPVAIASLTHVAGQGLPRLRNAIATFYKVLFIHVVPIAVVGMMYGDKLVGMLYGQHMASAGAIAQVFFGVHVLFFLTAGVTVGAYALGNPWTGFRIALLQAFVNVALDYLLIPEFGIPGAICAVLGTIILVTPLLLRAYGELLGHGLVPWQYLLRCGLASSLMLVLLPFRQAVTTPLPLAGILGLASILYLIGIRLLGLVGPEETRLLRASGLPVAHLIASVLGTPNPQSNSQL